MTGCSTVTSASAQPNWRDIDPCALVENQQLDRIADNPSLLKTQRTDDETHTGCAYTDPYGMVRFEIGLGAGAPTPPSPPPAVAPPRALRINDKPATATFERSGNCDVWVQLTDVVVAVTVKPTPGKSTVALGDTSPASCDAQAPLVGSVLEHTGLS
ncbi:hypothetical protein [Nocardia callitridis]|uniref:hypothetical protein n=1 Tax=Nocardia callitridis TaxID=648753 RepID=UPI0031F0E657